MAARDHNGADRSGDEQPSRLGYFAAIFVSALGHVGIVAFVLFVAPRYLHPAEPLQIAYTVKIVDNIPAGDLGTHLPKLSNRKQPAASAEAPKPVEPKVKVEPPKPIAADDDKEAIALNTKSQPTVTETPTPEPTPQPTVAATPEPTVNPTATPKATKSPRPRPTPTPAAKRGTGKPKSGPTIAIARAEATPSVEDRMAALKRKLMAEHLKERAKHPDEDEGDEDTDEATDTTAGPSGGGPVAGKVASAGRGMGIGGGTGSEGIQQDLDFLLYYQTVQDRIKQAWTFVGGSNDLAATVEFAIGPDGALTAAKIGKSSNDSAYDDSVIRAIRHAAPFPPPPEKFRDRFAAGIEALFKLGELKS